MTYHGPTSIYSIQISRLISTTNMNAKRHQSTSNFNHNQCDCYIKCISDDSLAVRLYVHNTRCFSYRKLRRVWFFGIWFDSTKSPSLIRFLQPKIDNIKLIAATTRNSLHLSWSKSHPKQL